MSSTSNTRLVFENVPWNHEAINASFEEVRIQDYLKAYKSTGRPPAPCPSLPADDSARIAMGLPPLFKPLIVDESANTSQVAGGQPAGAEEPPPHPHVWQEQKMDQENFQSLAAQGNFAKWSFEELRVQAILKGSGHLYIPPTGSVQAAPPNTTISVAPTADPREQMLNISARPGYEQHSQEEHRVVYTLWRREMTSEEIFRMQAGSVPQNVQAAPTPAFASSGVLGSGAGGSTSSGPWLGQSRSLPLPQTTSVGGVGNGSLFGPSPQRRW